MLLNGFNTKRIFLSLISVIVIIPSLVGQLELTTNGGFQTPNTCTEMNAKCAPSA